MKIRHLLIVGILSVGLEVRAASVFMDGVEQPTAASGMTSLTNGQVQATNIAAGALGDVKYLGSNQTVTGNNTHMGNEIFSNAFKSTQVELLDPPTLGTVFSNSLSAAVGGNGGAVYSNGFYVSGTFPTLTWFNSTNSTYSIQHSGNNDGEFGWTNANSYQFGEWFARATVITTRGPGTIGSVSIRIISAAGAVLAQVNSSNNPLGQIITVGYTGANVRGVSLLRAGAVGQTSTLDFNDLYLTNATIYDIASPGQVAIRAPSGITVSAPSITPTVSGAVALGTAEIPFAEVNARTGTYETVIVNSNTLIIGGAGGQSLSASNGAIVTSGSLLVAGDQTIVGNGYIGVGMTNPASAFTVDGDMWSTSGWVMAHAGFKHHTNQIQVTNGTITLNGVAIGGSGIAAETNYADHVVLARNAGQFFASATLVTQTWDVVSSNQNVTFNTTNNSFRFSGPGPIKLEISNYLTNNASGGRITYFMTRNGVLEKSFYDLDAEAINDFKVVAAHEFYNPTATDVWAVIFYGVGGMGTYNAATTYNWLEVKRTPKP